MTSITIDITGLSGTTNIELSAYDSTETYATPQYIQIISGAISLTLASSPSKTIYIGGIDTIPVAFKLINNTGTSATFTLTKNGTAIDTIENITESNRTIIEYLKSFIFTESYTPTAGDKFYFTAVATTTLNSTLISSDTISFNITVADGNTLTIVTDNISDQSTGSLTEFTKGS
jgi:hypothetical protein